MIGDKSIDLNLHFNGSYSLFRWILRKYKKELPYNGEVKQFALANNYCPKICDHWRNYGVGYRVWNLLHKDLTIAFLMNKINVSNIYDLQNMYEAWKKDDTISINDYK